MRTLAVDAQTAQVVAALDRPRRRLAAAQGAGVARRLYARGGQRFYGDTDLLVAPRSLDGARRVLRELGYEPWFGDRSAAADRPPRLALAALPGSRLEVDLHHTLTGVRGRPAGAVGARCRSTRRRWRCTGRPCACPATAALALHVALHAAQHGIARDTPRRDLHEALERLAPATWQAAAALAARVDASTRSASGCGCCPTAPRSPPRLGLPPNRSRNAALRVMAAPSVTLGLDRLATTPGARAKARLALGWTFPPPDFMRTGSGLARRGRAGCCSPTPGGRWPWPARAGGGPRVAAGGTRHPRCARVSGSSRAADRACDHVAFGFRLEGVPVARAHRRGAARLAGADRALPAWARRFGAPPPRRVERAALARPRRLARTRPRRSHRDLPQPARGRRRHAHPPAPGPRRGADGALARSRGAARRSASWRAPAPGAWQAPTRPARARSSPASRGAARRSSATTCSSSTARARRSPARAASTCAGRRSAAMARPTGCARCVATRACAWIWRRWRRRPGCAAGSFWSGAAASRPCAARRRPAWAACSRSGGGRTQAIDPRVLLALASLPAWTLRRPRGAAHACSSHARACSTSSPVPASEAAALMAQGRAAPAPARRAVSSGRCSRTRRSCSTSRVALLLDQRHRDAALAAARARARRAAQLIAAVTERWDVLPADAGRATSTCSARSSRRRGCSSRRPAQAGWRLSSSKPAEAVAGSPSSHAWAANGGPCLTPITRSRAIALARQPALAHDRALQARPAGPPHDRLHAAPRRRAAGRAPAAARARRARTVRSPRCAAAHARSAQRRAASRRHAAPERRADARASSTVCPISPRVRAGLRSRRDGGTELLRDRSAQGRDDRAVPRPARARRRVPAGGQGAALLRLPRRPLRRPPPVPRRGHRAAALRRAVRRRRRRDARSATARRRTSSSPGAAEAIAADVPERADRGDPAPAGRPRLRALVALPRGRRRADRRLRRGGTAGGPAAGGRLSVHVPLPRLGSLQRAAAAVLRALRPRPRARAPLRRPRAPIPPRSCAPTLRFLGLDASRGRRAVERHNEMPVPRFPRLQRALEGRGRAGRVVRTVLPPAARQAAAGWTRAHLSHKPSLDAGLRAALTGDFAEEIDRLEAAHRSRPVGLAALMPAAFPAVPAAGAARDRLRARHRRRAARAEARPRACARDRAPRSTTPSAGRCCGRRASSASPAAATPRRSWPPLPRSPGARGWRCRSRPRIAFPPLPATHEDDWQEQVVRPSRPARLGAHHVHRRARLGRAGRAVGPAPPWRAVAVQRASSRPAVRARRRRVAAHGRRRRRAVRPAALARGAGAPGRPQSAHGRATSRRSAWPSRLRRVRSELLARRHEIRWPWLHPHVDALINRRRADWQARTPRRWNAALGRWWQSRTPVVLTQTHGAARRRLADAGRAAVSRARPCWTPRPPQFGARGPGDRTTAMRAVFGDALPDRVLARRSKATFNDAFFSASQPRVRGAVER